MNQSFTTIPIKYDQTILYALHANTLAEIYPDANPRQGRRLVARSQALDRWPIP